jgi:hypothetical protein
MELANFLQVGGKFVQARVVEVLAGIIRVRLDRIRGDQDRLRSKTACVRRLLDIGGMAPRLSISSPRPMSRRSICRRGTCSRHSYRGCFTTIRSSPGAAGLATGRAWIWRWFRCIAPRPRTPYSGLCLRIAHDNAVDEQGNVAGNKDCDRQRRPSRGATPTCGSPGGPVRAN